jgi:hypothetical protein
MATLDQLKDADERSFAARMIPADVLSRLSIAELRYRTRHGRHLINRAREVPVRESQQALSAHAAKIMASEPAVDHIHKRMRHQALADGAPSHLWGAYFDMVRTHRGAHDYPPGLLAACNQVLEGRPVVGDPELAAVAEACVNHARTAKH